MIEREGAHGESPAEGEWNSLLVVARKASDEVERAEGRGVRFG